MKLKRWELVLVGNESGIRVPLSFLRFRTLRQAVASRDWLNARPETLAEALVHYEVQRR